MNTTHKWTWLQSYDDYVDFDKELLSIPDKGRTSVDMRLTFDTTMRECYFRIALHNDNGQTLDWDRSHHVPWAVGLALLAADGLDLPEELDAASRQTSA